MGLIKTADSDSGKGSLGTTIAAGGAGAVLGNVLGAGGAIAANKRLSDLESSGALSGNLTPKETRRLERAFGISPKLRLQHIDRPGNSKYMPIDIIEWDRHGNPATMTVRENGESKTINAMRGEAGRLQRLYYKYHDAAYRRGKGTIGEGDKKTLAKIERRFLKAVEKACDGAVISDRSSYVYLHELGHATGPAGLSTNMGNGEKKLRLAYNAAGTLGNRLNHTLIPGGIAAARQAHKEQTGEDSLGLRIADYAGRGASAVNLFEEGQATARALAKLHGVQGWSGVRRAAGHLLPAYMTYASLPIANHVIAPLAVKGGFALKRHMDEGDVRPAPSVEG